MPAFANKASKRNYGGGQAGLQEKNERGQKLISGELDVSELEIDTST
ncbi:hypothetical protein [Thiolapillus sp.]|nr:hypothetical protein [Thiolapillus sp.]